MLLRRITKHLRDQDWFAVFVDFIIVVAGILIAFQITEWNEERQQKITANNYIERLREDLLANQEDISQRIVYFSKTRSHALDALTSLDKDVEQLGVQFLVDIYQTSQILPRDVGRDSYDEILSVGANNALADLEVRKRLANHYRGTKSQITNFDLVTSYREIIRSNMPYPVQAAIRAACDDIITNGIYGEPIAVLPESCAPIMTAEQLNNGIQAILALDIRIPLIRRLSDLDTKITQSEVFIERAKSIEQYLASLPK